MRNTITLNGIASTTIAGLLIQELPAISKPLMRTEIEEIDGRDGDIVTELGYSAYDKEITIGLYGTYDINAVIKYFASEGTVVFSNESDKYYRYKIIDQIDFERLVRYRTATVTFHCQPFKFPTNETPVQLGSGQAVSGEGTDITLANTSLAPFVSITPKGDTFQQIYTGKNVFNINTTPTWFGADTTYSVSGNTLHVEGNWFVGIKTPVEANTDYYVSAIRKNVASANRAGYISVYGEYNTNQLANLEMNNGTFNSGNRTSVYIVFYSDSGGDNGSADFENIQLEKGTTGSDYEPYVGGTASPNPDYPQDVKVVTGEQTVTVTGKNILPSVNTTRTISGVTFTPREDGSILINGTASAQINYPVNVDSANIVRNIELTSGTYYIDDSIDVSGVFIQAYYTVDGGPGRYSTNVFTFTGEALLGAYIRVNNGTQVNNVVVYPQLELGSTATTYEPYQSQKYSIYLPLDKIDGLITQGTLTGDGLDANSNTRVRTIYIPAKPSTEYTIYASTTQEKTLQVSVSYYTINDYTTARVSYLNWTGGLDTGVSFTTPANAKYIRVLFKFNDDSSINPSYVYNAKIRNEAYTPLELCKIDDYQDYIYKSGGNWYLHEEIGKVVLNGTEGWTGTSNVFYSLPKTDSKVTMLSLETYGNLKSICSHFTKDVYEANTIGKYYSGSNNLNFNWDNSHANLAAFKTWLASNDVRLYAPLKTATDTQITDTDLIAQLEALASANSYRGTTYIDTASDGYNLPVIIAATATGNMDGIVTNSGNTYSRPKLTIYGTGTIGIYLDGNQMFSVDMGDNDHITIDTNAMNAYKDTTDNLKNRLVTGDYSQFKLATGDNSITFTGNSTKCIVENYTRWI